MHTQEAACPISILLLFTLAINWIFIRALYRKREKKAERQGWEDEERGGRVGEGWKEGKNRLHFPACPAAEPALFR